jgi:tRNA threonylcarbamoyladenosine biosynthesis protein TsaB
MGEVYAAPMQRLAPGRWRALQRCAVYTPQALLDAVAGAGFGTALAGPALAVYPELAAPADRWPLARPGGEALARVARAAWAAGEARAADQALPLYGRDKVAHTSAERAALRTAALASAGAADSAQGLPDALSPTTPG